MGTVLSHIIQTRYSKEFENIATDALIYVLKESKKAKAEMVNVLRSVVPTLPNLEFYSQGQKQNTRPDICGKSNNKELVYIENKFWAGLTKNQPVTYLQNLSKSEPETLLLFVVPGLREQAMKGELARKLKVADIGFNTKENLPTGIVWAVKTDLGTTLALTSWQRLIKILEAATEDEKETIENLEQLNSLCILADNSSFTPFTEEFLNDHNYPSYLIQIGQLITDSIEEVKKERIWVGGKTSSYGSYGTYLRTNNDKGPEFFFGENYELWKKTGRSPLWAIFSGSEYGQAYKVKPLIDKWSNNEDMLIEKHGDGIAIAINILPNSDKDEVLEDIVKQLNQLADILIGVERIDNR